VFLCDGMVRGWARSLWSVRLWVRNEKDRNGVRDVSGKTAWWDCTCRSCLGAQDNAWAIPGFFRFTSQWSSLTGHGKAGAWWGMGIGIGKQWCWWEERSRHLIHDDQSNGLPNGKIKANKKHYIAQRWPEIGSRNWYVLGVLEDEPDSSFFLRMSLNYNGLL
jgi:hypothetical protein